MKPMDEQPQASPSRRGALRTVGPDDEEFLVALYASAHGDELAAMGWDAAQREALIRVQHLAQMAHYRQHYPAGTHEIILVNEQPVGRLYTATLANEIRILDITILHQHRNQGIGTPLLKEIMAAGARAGKPVRIYVESYNRSLGLFERLGFRKTEENGLLWLMAWQPSPAV